MDSERRPVALRGTPISLEAQIMDCWLGFRCDWTVEPWESRMGRKMREPLERKPVRSLGDRCVRAPAGELLVALWAPLV